MYEKSVIAACLFLVACTSVPVETQCLGDNDCRAAACCHATDAVNKDHAPDCAVIACSQECREGTLDCQQGEVKCVRGRCTAVFS